MACPSAALSVEPTLPRFVYYKILTLVPVTAAIVSMVRVSESLLWPLVYVGACLTHASIMYSVKCPHCAYYKLGRSALSCFIWRGVPRLWKPREGPERSWVKNYAMFGVLVLTFFPGYWLWQNKVLLLIYFLGIAGLLMSIFLNECSRCLHFDCGNCRVPEEIRKEYLERLR